MADAILDVVKHIRKAKYEDLPAAAIDYAKRAILDTIANTIAGSTSETCNCKAIVELVKEWGGKEESSIWVYGGKVPANLAALAIGPMTHSLVMGDFYEVGTSAHVTEHILPAAFPIAERQGGVNGKDFITALALGQDLIIRLQETIIIPAGEPFVPNYELNAIFGATAAVTKLLGFDEETMWNAMGLAYGQGVGGLQGCLDGVMAEFVEFGYTADAAIKAALLAERGITGPKNILQGKYSIYALFAPEHNLEPLTSGLGKVFKGADLSLKKYAGCRGSHPAIEATIELATEHDIKPQEVERIDVGVGPATYFLNCQPEEFKINPRHRGDTQESVPYAVATAVIRRDVFFEDYTAQAMNRPYLRDLMRRVKTRIAPEVVTEDNPSFGGAEVTIKTKGGKEYSKVKYYAKGHPKNPVTMNEVIEKFRQCLPFSARPLPKENGEKVIKMVKNLENIDDVAEIVKLLVP